MLVASTATSSVAAAVASTIPAISTAVTARPSAASSFTHGTRFVHNQGSAKESLPIGRLNCTFGIRVITDFNKTEPP
jgi:hypothetical protein